MAGPVAMFGPDGQVHDVDPADVQAAMSSGGELAHAVINPADGQSHWVRHSQLGDALRAGGVPEGAMQMRRPMNQNPSLLQQIDSGVTALGSALNQGMPAMLHSLANPVQAGQQAAISGLESAANQPTTGAKVAATAAPFVGVDPEAVKRAAIVAGTTGNYGPLVATGVLPIAAAHIATSKVGPSVGDVTNELAAGEINPNAVPIRARAGDNLNAVSQAAGTKPIDLAAPGQSALNIMRLAKSGGSMPKVVNDFLRRVTDPNQGPLTYDEAREFYSNASRISADEMGRLTPVMTRALGKFTSDLGSSIAQAAEDAGAGGQYRAGMNEYAAAAKNAKRAELIKDVIKNTAKAAIPAAGAAYTAKTIWDAKR